MSSEPIDRRPRTRSLVARITAWYALAFIAMLAALVAFAASTIHDAIEREDAVIVETKVARHVAVLATDGLTRYRSAVEDSARLGDDEVAVRVRDDAGNTLYQHGNLSASLHTASRTTRELRVDVGAVAAPWQAIVDRMRPGMVVLLVAALLLATVGGFVVTRRALRPIRTLAAAARDVTISGDLSRRVPANDRGDELDELSVLFNRMLERNQRLVRGMRDALDNVAHDLRTPLTRLRANAEVALRSDDALAAREALGETIEETERVLAMLRTLMDISEAESGIMRLDRSRVGLAQLAEDVVALYEHVADEAGIVLTIDRADDVIVDVDAARIRQAIANLVDNAIKYNRRGGRVTIAVSQVGSDALIRVIDTGEGIPAESLPRIWDRLYRADPSRSRPGLGLGLGLVRAIVDAHGGSVAVDSKLGGGTTFTISLPSAPREPPRMNTRVNAPS